MYMSSSHEILWEISLMHSCPYNDRDLSSLFTSYLEHLVDHIVPVSSGMLCAHLRCCTDCVISNNQDVSHELPVYRSGVLVPNDSAGRRAR